MNTFLKYSWIALATTAAFAQTTDELITEGRMFLVNSNVASAKSRFLTAVSQSPTNETANALLAITRLAALVNEPAASNFLNAVGLPAAGRNLYAWTAQPPRDTNGVLMVPSPFSTSEVKAQVRTNILPAITAAAANLELVRSAGFLLSLSQDETKSVPVDADTGDCRLILSMLRFVEFAVYTANGWNVDLQLAFLQHLSTNEEPETAESVLARFPALGTFETLNDLVLARAALGQAISNYVSASAFIRSRPTPEIRLFNFDPDMAGDEERFRQSLSDLEASLQTQTVWSYDGQYTLFARRLFESPASPRSLLPVIAGNDVMAGTLPDPTFGGIVGGFSRSDVENFLTGEDRSGDFVRVVTQILSAQLGSGGPGEIECAGIDEQLYGLEMSPDLIRWELLQTGTAVDGRVRFQNVLASGSTSRFYRLRELNTWVRAVGKVISLPSQMPVAGALVTLTVASDVNPTNQAPRSFTATTDAVGAFTIQTDVEWRFWGGMYELGVNGGGYPLAEIREYSAPHIVRDVFLANRPPNDNFSARGTLAGTVTSAYGWNVGATVEPTEPYLGGSNSVWWTWTAPVSSLVTLSAKGDAFGPRVDVYSGDQVGNLVNVATATENLNFRALAGNSYQVRVGSWTSWQASSGTINLELIVVPPPGNDDFANRSNIVGKSAHFRASNLAATQEAGEANTSGRSVWWSWQAPASGAVRITISGDEIWPEVSVYEGTALGSLAAVAQGGGEVRFTATAGMTYQIRVGDRAAGWGQEGGSFLFELRPLPPPRNDNFAQRRVLTGAYVWIDGYNCGASRETGELIHAGDPGGHSVWFSWTAPRLGNVQIETHGSRFDTLLAVYRGASVDALTLVAADDDSGGTNGASRVAFAAQPGVTYEIAVDGKNGALGDYVLDLFPVP